MVQALLAARTGMAALVILFGAPPDCTVPRGSHDQPSVTSQAALQQDERACDACANLEAESGKQLSESADRELTSKRSITHCAAPQPASPAIDCNGQRSEKSRETTKATTP